MALQQIHTINEVVNYFKSHPHDKHPKPADVQELTASVNPIMPDNKLYWDVWRSDFIDPDKRYPFVDGTAKLMLSRQIPIGEDIYSAVIVLPFDLDRVIAKVTLEESNMTIWVWKNAYYWQYVRGMQQAFKHSFEEYQPKMLTVGQMLLAQMDSQTPGHTDLAASA